MAAADGRPRKGQEDSETAIAADFIAANRQPQKGWSKAVTAGEGLPGIEGKGSGGAKKTAGDLVAAKGSQRVSADRTVTRLGLVRIRAPGAGQPDVSFPTSKAIPPFPFPLCPVIQAFTGKPIVPCLLHTGTRVSACN